MELIGIELLILGILGIMILILKQFGADTKNLSWMTMIILGLFSIIDIFLTLKGVQLV